MATIIENVVEIITQIEPNNRYMRKGFSNIYIMTQYPDLYFKRSKTQMWKKYKISSKRYCYSAFPAGNFVKYKRISKHISKTNIRKMKHDTGYLFIYGDSYAFMRLDFNRSSYYINPDLNLDSPLDLALFVDDKKKEIKTRYLNLSTIIGM